MTFILTNGAQYDTVCDEITITDNFNIKTTIHDYLNKPFILTTNKLIMLYIASFFFSHKALTRSKRRHSHICIHIYIYIYIYIYTYIYIYNISISTIIAVLLGGGSLDRHQRRKRAARDADIHGWHHWDVACRCSRCHWCHHHVLGGRLVVVRHVVRPRIIIRCRRLWRGRDGRSGANATYGRVHGCRIPPGRPRRIHGPQQIQ